MGQDRARRECEARLGPVDIQVGHAVAALLQAILVEPPLALAFALPNSSWVFLFLLAASA